MFNRRSIRLKDYNYRHAGAYFITICASRQACLFGDIRNGEMILNEVGQIVQDLWQMIPQKRSNIELDVFAVMPNHLHGIIHIVHTNVERRTSDVYHVETTTVTTLPSASLGAIIGQYKSAVTKHCRSVLTTPPGPIWQRNYHEHIIRNEMALTRIRAYIVKNPARWLEDDLYAE